MKDLQGSKLFNKNSFQLSSENQRNQLNENISPENTCKVFVKAKPNHNKNLKKHFRINEIVNNVSYPVTKSCISQFKFDKVFGEHTSEEELYRVILIPLLQSVYEEGKDSSLIAYGCKNTGKSFTIGTLDDFYTKTNAVFTSLIYFFDKLNDSSNSQIKIQLSCFEIYNNTINDLLSNCVENEDAASNITSHYVATLNEAVDLLSKGLELRKKFLTEKYIESLSHIIINIEVTRIVERTGTHDGAEKLKGVLTLVDLAGIQEEYTNRASFEGGKKPLDITDISISSDQYRKYEKKLIKYRKANRENLNGLRVLKNYIQISSKNPEASFVESLRESNALIQILGQNFKTDYHVFLLIHINQYEEDPSKIIHELETLQFGKVFKNGIGKILSENEYENSNQSQSSEENMTNVSNILGELRNEPIDNPSTINHSQTVEVSNNKELPSELISKIVSFANDVNHTVHNNISTIKPECEPFISANISNILNEKEKNGRSSLVSELDIKDREIIKDIKSINKEINDKIESMKKRPSLEKNIAEKNTDAFIQIIENNSMINKNKMNSNSINQNKNKLIKSNDENGFKQNSHTKIMSNSMRTVFELSDRKDKVSLDINDYLTMIASANYFIAITMKELMNRLTGISEVIPNSSCFNCSKQKIVRPLKFKYAKQVLKVNYQSKNLSKIRSERNEKLNFLSKEKEEKTKKNAKYLGKPLITNKTALISKKFENNPGKLFYKRPFPLNNKTHDAIFNNIDQLSSKKNHQESNVNFINTKEAKNHLLAQEKAKEKAHCLLFENNIQNQNKVNHIVKKNEDIEFQSKQNLKIIANNLSFSTKKN